MFGYILPQYHILIEVCATRMYSIFEALRFLYSKRELDNYVLHVRMSKVKLHVFNLTMLQNIVTSVTQKHKRYRCDKINLTFPKNPNINVPIILMLWRFHSAFYL